MEKTDLGEKEERENMRTNGDFGAGMSKSFHIMDQTSARPLTKHRILRCLNTRTKVQFHQHIWVFHC